MCAVKSFVKMASIRTHLIGLLALLLSPPLPAHAADQPATERAYYEWKAALSKAAPDPDAWLPTRRMIARRLLAAVDAGGKTPLSVAELRALRADFGSDDIVLFTAPVLCNGEQKDVEFYLWTWQRPVTQVDEQMNWHRAAGCVIAAGIGDGAARGYKIAREAGWSFPRAYRWALLPDGLPKPDLKTLDRDRPTALETGPRIFVVANMLGALNPRIDALRYDEVIEIINAALWPFMEKELLLPRSRPGMFFGAADIELRGFMHENLRCLEEGLSELTSKKTSASWFEDSFSAYKPLKADYLSSDPRAEDPRVPLLAFVFEFTTSHYFNICRNDANVDIVSNKTRDSMAATILSPSVSGTLSAKLDQFRSCIEALPTVHKARRRLGVVDELGPIGCSRLAFSSGSSAELAAKLKAQEQTRENGGDQRPGERDRNSLCRRVWLDNFYGETFNEQIERFRSAGKANNKAAICTAAREIKTWAAAILKAVATYCSPDEPPFVGAVRQTSVENAIKKNCPP